MLARTLQSKRRPATAAVETAFIIIPIMMFFGGVFEYGRFLMVRQLLNNAAREGCRWAIVNTGSGTNSSIQTTVYNTVTNYMGGRTRDLTAWSSTSVVCYGTQNGNAVADVTTLMPGDFITVNVGNTNAPAGVTPPSAVNFMFLNVIPLIPLPTSVPMSSSCTMLVEGGT